ncbi:hypothetical protein [Winogradskyella flava]|uniref:Type I restriction enzyme R protein N terminus (HSDR_N) n=1 Tax=Winogradskyella flava TaxID=1884876 RepID=A0A842IW86_9FLAO|nr:hypothetical protein [Winogradskyella flava]MBC2845068.1 hypothetical protein [Winogradskyella flava]
MDTEEILNNIELAILELYDSDIDLLKRNLSERIFSAKLSEYLDIYFNDYDVDPEYNGDFDKPNDRKALDIARNRIEEIGRKVNKNNNYRLAPDIIIHERGTNNNNLVVIEVKKDISSKAEKEYDLIKLEHLTISYLGNHYNYNLGILLILGTGENAGQHQMICFKEGAPI